MGKLTNQMTGEKMKTKRTYLPDSELTYGPKRPDYRTVDGNQYKWDGECWQFICGPEFASECMAGFYN